MVVFLELEKRSYTEVESSEVCSETTVMTRIR